MEYEELCGSRGGVAFQLLFSMQASRPERAAYQGLEARNLTHPQMHFGRSELRHARNGETEALVDPMI